MTHTPAIACFLILLLAGAVFSGCITSPDNSDVLRNTNQTAEVIAIALNNATVQTYLKGNWSILEVSPNATVGVAGGIEYHVPDVIIETEPDILHVFVDPKNKTVVDIEVHGKRSPMPTRKPPRK